MAYADDIVLMAESKLKELSKNLINGVKRIDLEINFKKTEFIVIQRHVSENCYNECLEIKNF